MTEPLRLLPVLLALKCITTSWIPLCPEEGVTYSQLSFDTAVQSAEAAIVTDLMPSEAGSPTSRGSVRMEMLSGVEGFSHF